MLEQQLERGLHDASQRDLFLTPAPPGQQYGPPLHGVGASIQMQTSGVGSG